MYSPLKACLCAYVYSLAGGISLKTLQHRNVIFILFFFFFFMHRLCVHGKLELRSVVLGLTASANETSRVSYLDERVMSR